MLFSCLKNTHSLSILIWIAQTPFYTNINNQRLFSPLIAKVLPGYWICWYASWPLWMVICFSLIYCITVVPILVLVHLAFRFCCRNPPEIWAQFDAIGTVLDQVKDIDCNELYVLIISYRSTMNLILSSIITTFYNINGVQESLDSTSIMICCNVILPILAFFSPIAFALARKFDITSKNDLSSDRTIGQLIKNNNIQDIIELEMFGLYLPQWPNEYWNIKNILNETPFESSMKQCNFQHMDFFVNKGIFSDDIAGNQRLSIAIKYMHKIPAQVLSDVFRWHFNRIIKDDEQCSYAESLLMAYVFDTKDLNNLSRLLINNAAFNNQKFSSWTHPKSGHTCLTYAITKNNAQFCEFLFDNDKISVEMIVDKPNSKTQMTPIMYCMDAKNIKVIKYLIENNASINNIHPKTGDTPLIWSINHDRYELTKLLIHKNVDAKKCHSLSNLSPLMCCIRGNNLHSFRLLIDYDTSVANQECKINLDELLGFKSTVDVLTQYETQRGKDYATYYYLILDCHDLILSQLSLVSESTLWQYRSCTIYTSHTEYEINDTGLSKQGSFLLKASDVEAIVFPTNKQNKRYLNVEFNLGPDGYIGMPNFSITCKGIKHGVEIMNPLTLAQALVAENIKIDDQILEHLLTLVV